MCHCDRIQFDGVDIAKPGPTYKRQPGSSMTTLLHIPSLSPGQVPAPPSALSPFVLVPAVPRFEERFAHYGEFSGVNLLTP
jgi:hypothetical protein